MKARLFGTPASLPRVDRFELQECLGQGGMGVVYEAIDPALGRRVALKLLRSDTHGEPEQRRLLREAQALARLSHPNVAAVYEVGTSDGAVFLAMELVEGPTLRRWLADERRSRAAVLAMFVEAGRGLAAAHAAGLVHRDFKPDNVLVGNDGRARVVDFGLARPATRTDEPTEPTTDVAPHDVAITQRGALVGTPSYMAPEQLWGSAVDARADQFAFCVALFEALAGVRPYAGKSADELRDTVGRRTVDWSKLGPRVPRRVRRALARGLERDPARRYSSMDALLRELAPRSAGRRALAVGGAALAVSLGTIVWAAAAQPIPCASIEAELAGTWDDERKQRLATTFAAIDPDAGALHFDHVAPILDDWTADWVTHYRSACEAAHVERALPMQSYDRIAACLDRNRRGLVALVDRFAELEPTTLGEATKAVLSLPPPEACAGAAELEHADALPEDPIARIEVAAIRDAIADVAALEALGRFDEALARVEPAVQRARAGGFATIEAEALARKGKVQLRRGETTEALATLEDAVLVAYKAGHHEMVFEGCNDLVYVEGYLQHDVDTALRWARRAETALAELGHEARLAAGYEENLGTALHAANRWDEARMHYERSVAAVEEAYGPEHAAMAGVLSNLAALERQAGALDRARELATRALEIREATLHDHPDTALVLANLGTIDLVAGRGDDAIAAFERALAIYAATNGLEHLHAATLLSNLAVALDDAGRAEEALSRHREAVEAAAAASGKSSPQYSRALTNLGRSLLLLHRAEEGRGHLEEALALKRALFGDRGPELAVTLRLLGDAKLAEGDADAARQHYVRAQELYGEVPHAGLDLARVQLGQARAEAALGADARARELATAALDGLRQHGGSSDEIGAAQALAGATTRTSPSP